MLAQRRTGVALLGQGERHRLRPRRERLRSFGRQRESLLNQVASLLDRAEDARFSGNAQHLAGIEELNIGHAIVARAVLSGIEQAVRDTPEILDCYYVAGANDYLIRFTYRDAEDLERFHSQVLMHLPGVARSNSMLVLRTVKKTTALPL